MAKSRQMTLAWALLPLGMAIIPATAAQAAPQAESQPTSSRKACWQELDTGRSLCVDSLDDLADAVLSKYDVLLETPDGVVAPSQDNARTAAAADVSPQATSTVVGIIYNDQGYAGDSFVSSVGNGGCSAGHQYTYSDLRTISWNDRISSFRSYSGCKTTLWDNLNFTGPSYGPVTNSYYVGAAMNDRATSIRWAP